MSKGRLFAELCLALMIAIVMWLVVQAGREPPVPTPGAGYKTINLAPLQAAVVDGDLDKVTRFVSEGADINAQTTKGNNLSM